MEVEVGKALDLLEAARVGISTAFDLEPVDAFAAPFMEPEASALVSEITGYLEWAGRTPDNCITCGRKITGNAYRLPWCGACIAGESEQALTQAAELDALRGEVERLTGESFILAAGACINPNGIGLMGDEHGNSFCEVERERLKLDEQVTDLMATIAQLRDRVAGLEEGVSDLLPRGVCWDNPNIPDDTVLPIDITMGEIRKARALLSQNEVG